MKILTAFVTVLALVGFGTSAFACEGMKRMNQSAAQSGDAPVLPPTERG
jgi:hypothetical protein